MSIKELGPLASLVGVWQGNKGDDVAPSEDRGSENSKFRERLVFEQTGLVDNHEQLLYGLRYKKNAWRLSNGNMFHEENGFLMWDSALKQVFISFSIPRGVTVLAGGEVSPEQNQFCLTAEAGSEVYGICSNPFLIEEFKTVKFEIHFDIKSDSSFSYNETTYLKMKGRDELFQHTDSNTLEKVK